MSYHKDAQRYLNNIRPETLNHILYWILVSGTGEEILEKVGSLRVQVKEFSKMYGEMG